MKTPAALFLVLALAACASNGYRQFYQPEAVPPETVELLGKETAPQVVRSAADRYADTVQKYRSQGYALLGTAAFNGREEKPERAVAQARRLRATLVVLASRYTGTQTDIMQVPMLTSDYVYTQGVATIEGRPVPFTSGHSLYGTVVMPMAMQVRHYDHVAAFLAKMRVLPRSGLQLAELTPSLRKAYERNSGAVVEVVYENSPAFRADLLEGDLVVGIGGRDVRTPAEAQAALEAAPRGSTVMLKIIRDRKAKELPITL